MANITLNSGTGGAVMATEQNASAPNENYQIVEIASGAGAAFANRLNITAAGAAKIDASGTTIQANAGTNLNTSALALESGGNLAALLGRLPATAALADATANPTLSALQTYLMGYNGTTWDRLKSTSGALNVNLQNASVAVTGTFWQATQPVSGTVTANVGTTNGLALDATLTGGTAKAIPHTPAKGTTAAGDVTSSNVDANTQAMHVQLAGTQASVPVTGTFWQATQPVSGTVAATQSGNWTSRIVGNAGGVMDAAGQNAASPANELLVAGQFNTTPTTITSGNVSPLQLDTNGNLKVNVAAGGASGGTSSSFSSAFPATGTAAGASDGTNMKPLLVDASGFLKVNVSAGGAGGGVADTQVRNSANAWTDVGYASGNLNMPVQPGATLSTGSAWTSATTVNSTQTLYSGGAAPAVLLQLDQTTTLTGGAVTIEVSYDGTNWVSPAAGQVLDPTSASLAQISNPYTFQASTNKPFLILAHGAQAMRIRLSTVITGTGSVTPSISVLPLSPVGEVVIPGSVAVTGTFWQATQPVSGAVTANQGTANTHANAWFARLTDGTNDTVVKAASTAAAATDPALVVAVSPNNSVAVTGTFWQATQPVSGTVAATQSGTWTVQPGNTANTTAWLTSNVPPSNGTQGWSFNYQSALSSTKQQIKGSAGTFGGYIMLTNPNTTETYIQVFNKASASVTVGTTVPDFVLRLPGLATASGTGIAANLELVNGVAMSTGITVAATTTATGSTAPTNALTATFLYS